MQQGTNKPVLFISRYCKHCESLVMRLQRNDVLDKFSLVDIDSSHAALPPQITHVPSIMTQIAGRVVVMKENQLLKFVDTLLASRQHPQQQQQQPSVTAPTVEPCVGGKCSYAFLDGYETLDQPDTSYSAFDVAAEGSHASEAGLLMSPAMAQASQEAVKLREGDGALDQLVSSRNQDIQGIARTAT